MVNGGVQCSGYSLLFPAHMKEFVEMGYRLKSVDYILTLKISDLFNEDVYE